MIKLLQPESSILSAEFLGSNKASIRLENPMGAPASNWSDSDTDETTELDLLGGTLRFSSATELNTYVEDSSANMLGRRIRMVERNNTQINSVKAASSNVVEIPAERLNDFLIAGATAITDIDNVINELQAARDYLEAEAERVWRANARYAHLAKTASASARSIAESMGKWRNPESLSASPSLDASRDQEALPTGNEG